MVPAAQSKSKTPALPTNEYGQRIAARLVLSDGSIYNGLSIGVQGTAFGEIVFNTASTGYQEILTDPSYAGQVVLMTYPEIGNYGINMQDYESQRVHVAGFVVKRLSHVASSWRAEITLQEFLTQHRVVGIEGVDTRTITRKIRDHGTMKVGITTDDTLSNQDFLNDIQNQPNMEDHDWVHQVTVPRPYTLKSHTIDYPDLMLNKLVLIDFGMKENIVRSFQSFVREVIVLPANTKLADIQKHNPDGVFLSNGPGDPATLHDAVAMAKELIASGIPTFGICLGHQILSLACGAKVHKMAFGHHGANHPVKDLETGKIMITSQNHSYAVDFDTLPDDLKITHVNLNDGSIEGFRHKHLPVSSVQFHPEASPGPHDTQYLFARFISETIIRHHNGTTHG